MSRTKFGPGGPQTLPPVKHSDVLREGQSRGAQKIRAKGNPTPAAAEIRSIAKNGPQLVAAKYIVVEARISAVPTAVHPQPRPFCVKSIGWGQKQVKENGEFVWRRAIFFNGNGRLKYLPDDEVLCFFYPDGITDGVASDVAEFSEPQTTDTDKAENRKRYEAENAALARIAGLEKEPAPVEALINFSEVERPRIPDHVSEFQAYQPVPDPVVLPQLRPVKGGTPHETDRAQRKVPPTVRYVCDAHVKAYVEAKKAEEWRLRGRAALARLMAEEA